MGGRSATGGGQGGEDARGHMSRPARSLLAAAREKSSC
jgi:hypothetical protein